MTIVLIRDRKKTQTQREEEKDRKTCAVGGTDWSDATTSQGLPRVTQSWKRQRTDSP